VDGTKPGQCEAEALQAFGIPKVEAGRAIIGTTDFRKANRGDAKAV
jgi:hypothetical protein